jgi:hypothetical protein
MTAESESEMKSRMNESEAILRAREGDAEGFEYLYDSHRKHVYAFACACSRTQLMRKI